MNAAHPMDSEITLLIPTLGREILRRTLKSVLAGETWPGRILIVDQGRATGTAALATEMRQQGLDIQVLQLERIGKSIALNIGISQVTSRYVVITDDDCEVAPDWIARIAERLRRHAPAIVTGRVDAGEGEVQLSVVTSEVEEIQRRPALRFDRLSGGNMGMPLEVARRVGPFSEMHAMRNAEDTEYAYRALRARVPIVYAPEVSVRHLGWRDETQREDRYRSYARSHSAFFGWYLRQGDGFMLLRVAVHLLRSLRRWVVGALSGDPESARNGKAYLTEFLPGLREGWRGGALR
ncbi:MAG: glycosyltransferase [Steroidobacteraceae bacterium]